MLRQYLLIRMHTPYYLTLWEEEWILVHSLDDNEHLGHLYQLAFEKGVQLEEYPLKNYRACGLIQSLADN